jgi:hypothetical protein
MVDACKALARVVSHLDRLPDGVERKLFNFLPEIGPTFRLNERTAAILIMLGEVAAYKQVESLYNKFVSFFPELDKLPW